MDKMENSNSKEGLSADVMSALNTAKVGEVIVTPEQAIQDKFELWLESRRGKITGSNFGKLDVLPKAKADSSSV